jgi:hypothetical protein
MSTSKKAHKSANSTELEAMRNELARLAVDSVGELGQLIRSKSTPAYIRVQAIKLCLEYSTPRPAEEATSDHQTLTRIADILAGD